MRPGFKLGRTQNHRKGIKMKKFYSKNEKLIELLEENGIDLLCDDNMDILVSDYDALRIGIIVNEYAPAAINDYSLINL